jgi:hypothetical protein
LLRPGEMRARQRHRRPHPPQPALGRPARGDGIVFSGS